MVKNRRTNVKHLPRSHDESWLQRSLPKRWLTASLAVDPSDPLMIMTMTMTKLMRQGRQLPLSLSVDLQCKTTEMPRLKSLTKEINLGKLSSFCSSPVSGELHAPINVTLATKNYAQFRSVSRSDPIRSDPKMPGATFFSALVSVFFRFNLQSQIFYCLQFCWRCFYFFFWCCARETVTMKKDFWSVVFVAMAYLKLWPTSDARTQIRIRRRRGPFKTSSKLILAAKTVKCCEKNAKANPWDTKSNFYQLKDPRRDHHHHRHDHHVELGLANDE